MKTNTFSTAKIRKTIISMIVVFATLFSFGAIPNSFGGTTSPTITLSAASSSYDVGQYTVDSKSGSNVRAGAGTSNKIVGATKNKTSFYVSKVNKNWGYTTKIKCTNGFRSGWVCLDYCSYSYKKKTAPVTSTYTLQGKTIKKGGNYSISGVVKEKNNGGMLNRVSVEVIDKNGKSLYSNSAEPNSTTFELNNFSIPFSKLPSGEFTVLITVDSDFSRAVCEFPLIVEDTESRLVNAVNDLKPTFIQMVEEYTGCMKDMLSTGSSATIHKAILSNLGTVTGSAPTGFSSSISGILSDPNNYMSAVSIGTALYYAEEAYAAKYNVELLCSKAELTEEESLKLILEMKKFSVSARTANRLMWPIIQEYSTLADLSCTDQILALSSYYVNSAASSLLGDFGDSYKIIKVISGIYDSYANISDISFAFLQYTEAYDTYVSEENYWNDFYYKLLSLR